MLLLWLAVVSAAELSEDCQYVNSVRFLNDVDKVKNCFETYTIDQAIPDAILSTLGIIHDFYPYTDVAMNPPAEPSGYFKKMNFTSGLEDLKNQFQASGGVVSKIFQPTMKLINGFRDGHFRFSVTHVDGKYENIFSSVAAYIPFVWNAIVDGNKRNVQLYSPDPFVLSPETCDAITSLFQQGYYASKIDDKDAFEFFAQFFGDYNNMKSPQGTLVVSKILESQGFSVLSYPLDHLFQNHTIVFNDPDQTKITFYLGFVNTRVSPTRDEGDRFGSELIGIPIVDESLEREREFIEKLKNFKMRPTRQAHRIIFCDTSLNTENGMNYMQIPTFSADPLLFLQELAECVALFDTNSKPITVVLPGNGGGSLHLMYATQFMLMPTTDFRTASFAMRKSERSRHIALDKGYGESLVTDREACSGKFDESFWNRTETDDLGGGVTHKRTVRTFLDVKELMKEYVLSYAMSRNIRKPTDIVVATDGYCFSACSFFVNSIIKSGGAIVAGFGITNPGDDLFAAGQCPSTVLMEEDLPKFFDEMKSNADYGLQFGATFYESYDISPMNDIIPGDYRIFPVDIHTGYYCNSFNPLNMTQLNILLEKTEAVREKYEKECNPKNKRLILVSDECKPDKPFAVTCGYACGSNGQWDRTSSKIASCKEGYVVDFEKNECVPNTCDVRYTPPTSSMSSSKTSSKSQSSYSSSTILRPVVAVIIAFITLFSIML